MSVEVDGLVYGPNMIRALRIERDELAARLVALSTPSVSVTDEQVDAGLRKLIDELRPFAAKTLGSIRIDVDEVAKIVRFYDRVLEQFAASANANVKAAFNAGADSMYDALASANAPQPAAWVMVPREPTEEMLYAGYQQIDWCRDDQNTSTIDHPSQLSGNTCKQDIYAAYSVMLASAPAVPGWVVVPREPDGWMIHAASQVIQSFATMASEADCDETAANALKAAFAIAPKASAPPPPDADGGSLSEALERGTISCVGGDQPRVIIDFETFDEARGLFNILADPIAISNQGAA